MGAGITRDVTIRLRIQGPHVVGGAGGGGVRGAGFGDPSVLGVGPGAGAVSGAGAFRTPGGPGGVGAVGGIAGIGGAAGAFGARGGGNYERRLRDIARGTREVTQATRAWSQALGAASLEAARLFTWSRLVTRVTFGIQEFGPGAVGAVGVGGVGLAGAAGVVGLIDVMRGGEGFGGLRTRVGRAAATGNILQTLSLGFAGRGMERAAIQQESVAALQNVQQRRQARAQRVQGLAGISAIEARIEAQGLSQLLRGTELGVVDPSQTMVQANVRAEQLLRRRGRFQQQLQGLPRRDVEQGGFRRGLVEQQLRGARFLEQAGVTLGNVLFPGRGQQIFERFVGPGIAQRRARIEATLALRAGGGEDATQNFESLQERLRQTRTEEVQIRNRILDLAQREAQVKEQSLQRQVRLAVQVEQARVRELEAIRDAQLGVGFAAAQAGPFETRRAISQIQRALEGERVRQFSPLAIQAIGAAPEDIRRRIQAGQFRGDEDIQRLLGLLGFGPAIQEAEQNLQQAEENRQRFEQRLNQLTEDYREIITQQLRRINEITKQANEDELNKAVRVQAQQTAVVENPE